MYFSSDFKLICFVRKTQIIFSYVALIVFRTTGLILSLHLKGELRLKYTFYNLFIIILIIDCLCYRCVVLSEHRNVGEAWTRKCLEEQFKGLF